jgi:hypothetical protein
MRVAARRGSFMQRSTLAGCTILQQGALAVKHAPIIVLIILALGVAAVTIYRPHGNPRVHSIGTGCASCVGLLFVGSMHADNGRT